MIKLSTYNETVHGDRIWEVNQGHKLRLNIEDNQVPSGLDVSQKRRNDRGQLAGMGAELKRTAGWKQCWSEEMSKAHQDSNAQNYLAMGLRVLGCKCLW